MILVDSSIWIDFLSPAPGPAGNELHRLIEEAEPVVLTGIIVSEVLQGLTRDIAQIEQLLQMWEMIEPSGFSTYREAAAIFRMARERGTSLSTIDALIASIALERGATVFTLDQDFGRIARFTELSLYEPLDSST